MTERRWRVRVLFTFRGRPKTSTTDAAPGTLAISTQLRRSCRPVWATTQVQPDDVADQQRPRRWSSYGASGTCPAYSRISLRTWAFTGRLAVLPPILGWLTIVADA